MEEIHCWRCTRLIGKVEESGSGVVELKCKKCHAVNRVPLVSA